MYHFYCASGTLKGNMFNLHNCERPETKYSITLQLNTDFHKTYSKRFAFHSDINLCLVFMYFLRAQNSWQINRIEIFCPNESTFPR